MAWFAVAVATLVCCELLVRIPLIDRIRAVAESARRSASVIASPTISDHWKERALPRYALRMGVSAIMSFFWLLIAFSPFLLLALAGPLFHVDFVQLLLDPLVIVALTLASIGYMFMRSRWV
jgi:hypothetical protein